MMWILFILLVAVAVWNFTVGMGIMAAILLVLAFVALGVAIEGAIYD